MDKWEYRMENLPPYREWRRDEIVEWLNKFGQEGWQLVCIQYETLYYFKRELQDKPALSEIEETDSFYFSSL